MTRVTVSFYIKTRFREFNTKKYIRGEEITMEMKVKEILFSPEEIANTVKELGEKITKDYKEKNLLVISVLKGGFIFAADLVRNINLPLKLEFISTSSYGHDTKSSGQVQLKVDIETDISGYDVLVVDDIADSGLTMDFILNLLRKREPSSLKCCTLIDKPERRKVDLQPDYIGFTIPDKFIVGYGLNYGDYYRNVPYVFVWDTEK